LLHLEKKIAGVNSYILDESQINDESVLPEHSNDGNSAETTLVILPNDKDLNLDQQNICSIYVLFVVSFYEIM
jgi:hypothetical protein